MSQAPLTHRENNFDSVRLIAAAAVIYGHAHPLTQTPDRVFWGNSVESFAVKVFFVISGFLITASWLSDPSPFRYFAKRALRIFPALAVVVAVSALVLGPLVTTLPLSSYFASPQVPAYFSNIALRPVYYLPGVFDRLPYPGAVNGSLWSLPAEFAMYLLLPLLCVLGAKLRFRWVPAVATVGLCCWSLSGTGPGSRTARGVLRDRSCLGPRRRPVLHARGLVPEFTGSAASCRRRLPWDFSASVSSSSPRRR